MHRASFVLAVTLIVCASPKDDAAQAKASETAATAVQQPQLAVEEVAHGLENPVYLTAPASDAR